MTFEVAPKSTEIESNWEEAILYCFLLGEGWRLPTIEELNEIYHSENNFEKDWYWSSTENSGNYAGSQRFSDGFGSNYDKNYDGFYVRAIRDL